MPITSDQISMMQAQYQGQAMGSMQYASMIGAAPPMSEAITGGAMNRMAAIGGPLAMGGLSLAGLDPISLGLRAGMGASRMGMGFMGAGTVGLGAAGLAGAGVMAAGYVGNQFFTGAQQQQQFGANMNNVFRFNNQYGGQGFGRSGLGDIGGMMRQMTTEQGPMGQMAGFEELGRLASNMGRMGMAQGVRDAKDFSDKFREMVKSLKEIAHEMGTSLEEAQKMMGAMRGAGVFGTRNAVAASQRVRAGAVAGGMATSELTGMMQVGSQISRMVGGRGRAGAMGGLETITNIGVAQQMGIMSEEDVYNVTGLTGAEGRRAMATRQMEQSAQFFKGGIGRRFLASIAGKGGTLDEGSVEEYLAGGVGTDRTTQMYQRNLSKIGRADFIRNEGKLRGAALERLGGLAPMVAMKGWLEERGINVNEDQDRAMIFMQRQLGMGNDESEMMLRQVRALPQLLRQRNIASQDDQYMQRLAERRSNTGLEGLKKKFEGARAEVQATLQQVGASFYESMSEGVDQFINRLTDTYVKETRKDVSGAFRTAMGGGAIGAQAARTTFGVGAGSLGSIFGGASPFAKTGTTDLAAFQKSDADRFAKAGFAFQGGDLTGHISMVGQIANAFRGGDTGLAGREGIQSLGKQGAEAFRQALYNQQVSGKGMERLKGFGQFLQSQSGKGNVGLDELAQRYANAGNDVERAQIMAAYTGEGGAGQDQSTNFMDPGLRGIFGTSGFATKGEGDETVGNAFLNARMVNDTGAMMGVGASPWAMAGPTTRSSVSAGDAKAVGSFLRSEGGRGLIDKMFRGDQKSRDDAMRSAMDEVNKLQDKEKRTSADNAQLVAMKGIVMARQLHEMRINGATKEQIDAAAERMAKENGISVDDVRAQVDTVLSVAENSSHEAMAQAGERAGEESRENLLSLGRGGLVTGSGKDLHLNADKVEAIVNKKDTASRAFLAAVVETQKAFAAIGPNMSPEEKEKLFQQGLNSSQKMGDLMAGMSVAEQRRLAGSLQGIEGAEGIRGDLNRSAALGGQIEAGAKRGKMGGLTTAAGILGVNIGSQDMAAMLKSGKGGVGDVAKFIADSLGGDIGKDKALMDTLTSGLTAVQGGKTGEATRALQQFMNSDTVDKARIAKATAEDPNKNLMGIEGHTKEMNLKMATMVNTLDAINKRAQGNAEDWNPFH